MRKRREEVHAREEFHAKDLTEGCLLRVTGDREVMGHGFEDGTEVEFVLYDEGDDTCRVLNPETPEETYGTWVGRIDLELVPPLTDEDVADALRSIMSTIERQEDQ